MADKFVDIFAILHQFKSNIYSIYLFSIYLFHFFAHFADSRSEISIENSVKCLISYIRFHIKSAFITSRTHSNALADWVAAMAYMYNIKITNHPINDFRKSRNSNDVLLLLWLLLHSTNVFFPLPIILCYATVSINPLWLEQMVERRSRKYKNNICRRYEINPSIKREEKWQ